MDCCKEYKFLQADLGSALAKRTPSFHNYSITVNEIDKGMQLGG